jgi:hypothetical protein
MNIILSFNVFSQTKSEFYVNIANIGVGINVSSINFRNYNYEVLNLHYIFDRKIGVSFSPFHGIREYELANTSMFYDTISFFNIKLYYNIFTIPILQGYNDDESDVRNRYIAIGPYISSNYLNMDFEGNFGLKKIMYNIGLQTALHGRIRKTPFETFIELKFGYKYSNFGQYTHSFYFGFSYDIIGSAIGLARLSQAVQKDNNGGSDNLDNFSIK